MQAFSEVDANFRLVLLIGLQIGYFSSQRSQKLSEKSWSSFKRADFRGSITDSLKGNKMDHNCGVFLTIHKSIKQNDIKSLDL